MELECERLLLKVIMQPAHISSAIRVKSRSAFTLVEVVIALAISAILFGGIILGNTFACRRAEWAGYSLAAQSLAVQQVEQARAAVWYPSLNEVTNLNLIGWTYNSGTRVGTGQSVSILDIPIAGTNNIVYATNFVTIRMISLNNTVTPPVYVQMVQVDTVWLFKVGKSQLFTNTVATYIAPDNRDPDTL